MDTQNAVTAAITYFNKNKSVHLENLKDLVRIPSISFSGFDAAALTASAEATTKLLTKSGITDVRVLDSGSGHPAVFGQWTEAPGKPTILLYAHYDVQPIGRKELWITPPFAPDERDGRLYGRGVSDDKGGVVMHAAAIHSFLKTSGRLPINVKVLIEGEEEVGSTNLQKLLQSHKALLSADAVLIADSENFDAGIPSLTASLRGIVTVTVEVRSLTSSVHSGTWGGALPDPVLALAKMLGSLVDDQGKPAIPGLSDNLRLLSPKEQADLNELPFSEQAYRRQSKIINGVNFWGGEGTPYEKMWYRPSIAVNAIEASSRKQAANIINDTAWARVGVRTVPYMDAKKTLSLLRNHLLKHAPWGVHVTIEPESPSPWWRTDTEGPVFRTALSALEKGYGRTPVIVGAGGSIPFVQNITDALGGIPALLFGVGDPYAAAHSENENLLISDWENGCRSLMYLLGGLSEIRSN